LEAVLPAAEAARALEDPLLAQLELANDVVDDGAGAVPGARPLLAEAEEELRLRAHGIVAALRTDRLVEAAAVGEDARAEGHVRSVGLPRRDGTLLLRRQRRVCRAERHPVEDPARRRHR